MIAGTLLLLATPAWQAGSYFLWLHNEVVATSSFRAKYYADWGQEIEARRVKRFCEEHPGTCDPKDEDADDE